jgi:low temperature requirement protein LtrA
MASVAFRKSLFRDRDGDHSGRVINIELFFDLVFVFAITQLSHRLLAHLTLHGALETLVLFLAVWWVWMYTCWATNWLDPERPLVRAMLMVMMLGGLVLSVSLPTAFSENGLVFATIYVAMQLLRSLWIALISRGHNRARVRSFLRISFYFALSAPLWIVGALSDTETRLVCWAAALVVEYAAPSLFYRTPGLGKSQIEDWDISGEHMAERCALFIIIALGETVLVTGATFAGLPPETATIAAFGSSFIGSATMWWIYFDSGAKRGGEAIEHTDEAGRLGRNAYTYMHMPIVAGIIVTAVGDELMLAHPIGHVSLTYVLVACGGPALFLTGNALFKWMTVERAIPPLSHMAGVVALAGIAVGGWLGHWQPLTIGIAATVALIAAALWEWLALNGGYKRWLPWAAHTS